MMTNDEGMRFMSLLYYDVTNGKSMKRVLRDFGFISVTIESIINFLRIEQTIC